MSETGEQMGRCRREITAAYESTRYKPSDSDMLIADAIDRLAADVASIKAKVDAVSPEDVVHLVESEKAFAELFAEQRDAAIRERDQWREEARLAVINRDEARAEVERLRAELAAPQPAAPAAGWLTEEERGALSRAFDLLCDDDGDNQLARTVQALLSRAGSPPVVEVPAISERDVPKRNEALAYRAALDKAGVPWKEVGRE